MPRKTRKSCQKVKAQSGAEKENKGREEEKEKQYTNLEPAELQILTGTENLSNEEKKPQHSKFISQKENVKPSGFWRKKLQDLEENETKNKICKLYEFSGTDESESSYRIKKKPKQKTRIQKKKQTTGTKFIKPVKKTNKESELKSKQVQRKIVAREKVKLGQTCKQGTEKGKKLTFSTGTEALGITSTPAVKKDNLVEECNFLFLSPIIKEEIENDNSGSESLLFKEKAVHYGRVSENFAPETPKLKTKLKRISCRRVLRSGKLAC